MTAGLTIDAERYAKESPRRRIWARQPSSEQIESSSSKNRFLCCSILSRVRLLISSAVKGQLHISLTPAATSSGLAATICTYSGEKNSSLPPRLCVETTG